MKGREIRISDFVLEAVRDYAAAQGRRAPDCREARPDGAGWLLEVDEDVAAALERLDPDPDRALRMALSLPGYPMGRA